MLISSELTEKTFALDRSKESVDGAEVAVHLQKIKIAIEAANQQHEALRKHVETRGKELVIAQARIKELEAIPTPTQQQIDTIKLAERLHQQMLDEAIQSATQIKSDARAQAQTVIDEAHESGRQILEDLRDQKNTITRRIERLSEFERDHFVRITAFLEGQLGSVGTRAPEPLTPPTEEED